MDKKQVNKIEKSDIRMPPEERLADCDEPIKILLNLKPMILNCFGSSCVGKTTVLNAVYNILNALGFPVILVESECRRLQKNGLTLIGTPPGEQALLSMVNWAKIIDQAFTPVMVPGIDSYGKRVYPIVLCSELGVRSEAFAVNSAELIYNDLDDLDDTDDTDDNADKKQLVDEMVASHKSFTNFFMSEHFRSIANVINFYFKISEKIGFSTDSARTYDEGMQIAIDDYITDIISSLEDGDRIINKSADKPVQQVNAGETMTAVIQIVETVLHPNNISEYGFIPPKVECMYKF